MNKRDQIRFEIVDIATTEFAVIEENIDQSEDQEMKIIFLFDGLVEVSVIVIHVKCEFFINGSPAIIIAASFSYEIHPKDWKLVYDKKNSKITLPLEVALPMLSMSVGAIRGVLHAKTENTPAHSTIMPSVNLKDIIKEEIIIEV